VLSPAIPVDRDIVIELKVKRPAGNTNNVEIFWDDVGGGFAAVRSVIVPGATLNDGNYHVVRATFTGQIGVSLDRLRIDPHGTSGATFAIDYVRVYTNGGLDWDVNIASTGAQGGPGTWGTAFPTFWDGTGNVAWPTTGTGNAAVFGLNVDTVTLDAAGVAANVLSFPTANTTQATGYTLGAGGTLTLNGTDPTLFVCGETTINSALAGTAGLTKKGHRTLYLGGDNSGLSGSLNIHGFPNGINAGVVLTSNTAIGGVTTVNLLGDATYGGFIGLSGGLTLGSGVTINLNSTGGATASFPPGAIRSYGPGTINTIQGPINVTLTASRISNNDATRLDITGPITAGGNSVLFRNAPNEGIRLTNPANSWTGQTQNANGTLWADPYAALPTGSNLVLAVSEDAVFQTSGSITRNVGNLPGEVQWQNVTNGGRAGGFSARGGDLTVNLGGAGADLLFCANPVTSGTTALNSKSVTNIDTTNLVVGMNVSGTGIAANSTIAAITPGTPGSITLNNNATGAATVNLTFWQPNPARIGMNTLWLNGATADSKLTLVNPLDLNGANRTVRVSANVAELAGGIKGTTNLNKDGAGLLLLATPNTWTGGLNFAGGSNANRGIVRVTHNEALGPVGAVKNITASGSNRTTTILELAGGVTIDASKAFRMSGKSFWITTEPNIGSQFSLRNLSGNNTWEGNVIIAETGGSYGIESQAGTLTIGANPATGSVIQNQIVGTVDNREMALFGGGNFIINSMLADNGGNNLTIRHAGSGVVSITRGDNDFDTEPALWAGTTEIIKLDNGGLVSSLGTATALQVGGTLRYLGAGDSSDRLLKITQRGATLDSSGTGPLNLTSATLTHITGDGSSNAAPFALGATTVTVTRTCGAAVGQDVTGTAFAAGTTITAIDDATRTLTFSAPTVAASANGFTVGFANANNLDRTLTLAGSNAGDNTLAASLSNPGGTGKLGITKTGAGKWILSGATKTNTGPVDVQAGTLGFANSLPPGFAPTVAAGATLSLNNVMLPAGSPALDIDGTLDLAGPVTLALPGTPAPGTYPVLEYGALTGAGTLTSVYRVASFTPGATSTSITVGAGASLTWTGTTSGDWDVKTTPNWQDALTNPELFCWLDSVTFDATGSATQPIVNLTQEVRPLQVTVNEPTVDYTFTGTGFISGTASLTKSGAAKLIIATNNTNSGTTTIQAGTVEVGNGTANGALGTGNVTNDGILTFNRAGTYQFDGAISGSGAVSQIGSGTTVLTADHSYAGTTTIGAGTLRIGNRTATGKLGAGAVINDGILQISRSDNAYVVANDISGLGSVQIGINGVALPAAEWDSVVTLTGNNTFAGGITVNSGSLKIQSVAALGTGPKMITLTNGTNGRPQLQLDGSAGNLVLPADFSFTTSNQTFSHPAINNLAGDNVIGGTFSLVSGGGNTVVSVAGGSLTLNGGITNGITNRELMLGGAAATTGTINGLIADGPDGLRVSKSEPGTWILTNANTYTGTTVVNGGLLLINGDQTAATGNVTVNGGTLGGIGKVGGALTVNTGGTLAPGGTTGTLTTAANVTLDGTLVIEVNGTATDKLAVGGALDISGSTLTVTPTGAGLTQPAYIIAEANAPIVGNFAVTNVPPGYMVVVGYNDGVDTNNIALVPGVADPYLGWADDNSLTGANRAPDADPDNDGLENGIEFVIGADPNKATTTGRPTATTSGGNLIFTFKRSDASEAFDLFVEHSTTLQAPWTAIPVPVGVTAGPPVEVVEVDPGLDTVTVTIPMGTDRKKFARLRANIPYTP
jgi:fibronectin-binding autotransporter adhesin